MLKVHTLRMYYTTLDQFHDWNPRSTCKVQCGMTGDHRKCHISLVSGIEELDLKRRQAKVTNSFFSSIQQP